MLTIFFPFPQLLKDHPFFPTDVTSALMFLPSFSKRKKKRQKTEHESQNKNLRRQKKNPKRKYAHIQKQRVCNLLSVGQLLLGIGPALECG